MSSHNNSPKSALLCAGQSLGGDRGWESSTGTKKSPRNSKYLVRKPGTVWRAKLPNLLVPQTPVADIVVSELSVDSSNSNSPCLTVRSAASSESRQRAPKPEKRLKRQKGTRGAKSCGAIASEIQVMQAESRGQVDALREKVAELRKRRLQRRLK